jgi:hypothetical protein
MSVAEPLLIVPYWFSAASYVLVVETDVAGSESLTFGGSLNTSGRNYWATGDGQSDASTLGGPGDLLALLETCLETHSGITTASVSISSSTFLVSATLDSGDNTMKLLWDHGSTTLPKAIFGWDASDASFAATQTGANYPYGLWRPGMAIWEDSRWLSRSLRGSAYTMSGKCRTSDFGTGEDGRRINWQLLGKEKILQEYEAAAETNNSLEYIWEERLGAGSYARLYADESNISGGTANYDLIVAPTPMFDKGKCWQRNRRHDIYFDAALDMRKVTS